MGRNLKTLTDAYGQNRREEGYYSTPSFVSDYLASRLISINPNGKLVLDPCIGKGEMTKVWKDNQKIVIGFDNINRSPNYCDDFRNQDFLKYYIDRITNPLINQSRIVPDYIIANPPYNCHELDYIRDNKKILSSVYGKSTVLNTYSMFLKSIIDIAPTGCVIGVIVHDSFLTAKGHASLREYIRNNCAIYEIHLCPTSLFLDQGADVRTCLLVLRKNSVQPNNIFISERPLSNDAFRNHLQSKNFNSVPYNKIFLSGTRDNSEFLIGTPDDIISLFSSKRLDDIAPCITGISTGNDKKYLNTDQSDVFPIPFYKNPAKKRFFSKPDAFLIKDFIDEEKKVKNFMVRNKSYMFRGGISCSSMGVHFGATILPKEGAFGVNPNIIIEEDELKFALLSYLNSDLCFFLVRGVLIRSNMITAGYASRIPIPHFDKSLLKSLSSIGISAYEKVKNGMTPNEKEKIDQIVFEHFSLSDSIIQKIKHFSKNAVRLT